MNPSKEVTAAASTDAVTPEETFAQLGVRPEVLAALGNMGFTAPTPVQRAVFAPLMGGKDVVVQSETGSGKTAAFAIPMAQGLVTPGAAHVEALVLVPTRELALQVTEECRRIFVGRDLSCLTVYGGAPIGPQIEALKQKVQLVIGTPGRILDHLSRKTLDLRQVKFLVLDEADEMLSMGFWEAVTDIIRATPVEKRQTALFSATLPDAILRTSREFLRQPESITLSKTNVSAAAIRHAYALVSGMGKINDLVRLLAIHTPSLAIVFCNTREECATVSEALQRKGINAEAISGDLTQKERERVMTKMRARDLSVLVATDVAARGIDISQVSHVINFSLPESLEVYIHRSGRTGRAGNLGTAISLISPQEVGQFYLLKLTYQINFENLPIPTAEEEQIASQGRIVRALEEAAQRAPAPDDHWIELTRRIWTTTAHERLMAFAIKHWWTSQTARPLPVAEHPPAAPRLRPPAKPTTKIAGELPKPRTHTSQDEAPAKIPAGMARVTLQVGRKHGVNHSTLKQELLNLGVAPDRVHVRTDHSYFLIAIDQKEQVQTQLATGNWRNAPFSPQIEE